MVCKKQWIRVLLINTCIKKWLNYLDSLSDEFVETIDRKTSSDRWHYHTHSNLKNSRAMTSCFEGICALIIVGHLCTKRFLKQSVLLPNNYTCFMHYVAGWPFCSTLADNCTHPLEGAVHNTSIRAFFPSFMWVATLSHDVIVRAVWGFRGWITKLH